MTITEEQLKKILNNANVKEWVVAMNELFPKYDITTVERAAGFIAQTAHESNGYKVLSENLNYASTALNKIFPKYFVKAGRDATPYNRQPEKIANVIYAGRMGNGDTASGDGWKYRGGGILQLTGKVNYTNFGKSVGKTPEEATAYVRTPKGAIESALWFWKTNGLNAFCDKKDIVGMTKKINGGTIGLEDRKHHFEEALKILGSATPATVVAVAAPAVPAGLIKRGSKGDAVKKVQVALGLDADGIYGADTEMAVKAWQTEQGLVADGIVGPKSLAAMGA